MDRTALGRARWRRGPLLTAAKPPLRIGRWNVSWMLPAALLAAIALGDWHTSGDFRLVTWIVLVPGISAAVCGVPATALFAVAAAVTYVLLDTAWARDYQEGPADFLLVVAAGGLAVLAAWLRRRALFHLLRVENAAEATRLAVLRPIPSGVGGLESASTYLSADIAARVGGDFFDVQPSRHGARVLLGDVQGKGTSAVDAASALLGTFREAAYHERDLATVAERLEVRMRRQNSHDALLGRGEGRFATAVLVGFPPAGEDTDWVEMVNFGHVGPLAVGPDGVRGLPEGTGRPLGLSGLAEGELPPVQRVPLAPAETLLMFTDGVTEARDRTGTFLPLADHLAGAVSRTGARTGAGAGECPSPSELVRLVTDAVLDHTGGHLADDTAILAVRRLPPDGGPGPAGQDDGMMV